MKISDIIDKIEIRDSQEFFDFTNKWIDFVVSRKQSRDISDDDWQKLFTRNNPVAGIDRGEMLDKAMIPTKNGKEERITNERKSFRNKWDSDIRPKIEDIINTKEESEKIVKAKELSQLILQIIKDGGGRKMQVAINRILVTFFPDLFINIPNPDDLIKFIGKLHKVVDNGNDIIRSDNWIDNCYQIKKFFDKELKDDNLTASAWRFYDYLKEDECKDSNKTFDETKAIKMGEKNKYDDFLKLLSGNYNIILTGAPGTGKTYLAKEIAKAMGAEWKLVQFHPSYDYTDFVEGLRPIKEGDKLGFQRKDGAFKAFCKEALLHYKDNDLDDEKVKKLFEEEYKIAYQEIIDGNLTEIPIGKGKTKKTIYNENGQWGLTTGRERNNGKLGDFSYLNSILKYVSKKSFSNENIILFEDMRDVVGGNTSDIKYVIQFLYDRIIKRFNNKKSKPFVFIIDEINRGEISKIFGELFYSIDVGYRGEKGKVETQYQNLIPKEGDTDFDPNNPDVFRNGFYVPKNVYIIGTMNDIDRSVESMDFAMRRRFAWKEITAKSRQSMIDENNAWVNNEKPSQAIIDEIKIRMDNLNAAIIDQYGDEAFSNKDKIGLGKAYQIGAAYFLKYALYNNFDELWTNHLEGLLYEYLRGKTNINEKIERLHQAYNDTTPH